MVYKWNGSPFKISIPNSDSQWPLKDQSTDKNRPSILTAQQHKNRIRGSQSIDPVNDCAHL